MKFKPGDYLVFSSGGAEPMIARLNEIRRGGSQRYRCTCYCGGCSLDSDMGFDRDDFKREATDVEVLALKLRGTSIG